jgi:hypothetical protein
VFSPPSRIQPTSEDAKHLLIDGKPITGLSDAGPVYRVPVLQGFASSSPEYGAFELGTLHGLCMGCSGKRKAAEFRQEFNRHIIDEQEKKYFRQGQKAALFCRVCKYDLQQGSAQSF